ncbi:MAG: histidinol-phosphatase [Proteobacteria bacterium]|nr:histidinol-phosphatase [Pseudomonadota bacterium]
MTAEHRYSASLEPAEQREFLPFVYELAAASAAVIGAHYLQGESVQTKSDGSPVTAADRGAEEAMRDLIMRRYADHGILGEEHGLYQPAARYRWVLDPIDGTKAFISNCYIFGTLIALVRDGRPIIGAIASPLAGHVLVGLGGTQTVLGSMQTALGGTHAVPGGRTMRMRPCSRIEDATLLTTGHWEMVDHPEGGRAFEAITRRARLYRSWGDCHGYFQLATGGADLMFDPALKPWDIMAIVPVIEGAGGRVSTLAGDDPLQGSDMFASGGALHDEVLELLRA